MLPLRGAAVARRAGARLFATEPDPLSRLDQLLNTSEGHQLSPPDDPPTHPPQAPAGSLPPGGLSQTKYGSRSTRGRNELPRECTYRLHVASSRNNTILTFTDPIGNPRAWVSSGKCGFKKVQRSGYEAGYQCAVKMFGEIAKERARNPAAMKLEILFKGFGFGREALHRALMTTEGEQIRGLVARLTDATPLKIGGTKAKKARRL